ncbi:hypothetical protein D1871_09225 [Nakamurella silvestris]|nr:hypothetical protein D1871_09225 [Nakamurella silvestris]
MWSWSYATEAGVVVESLLDPGLEFDTQQEAEQWLTDLQDQLLDEGITAVSLSDGHQTVYGPMPLTPA